MKIKGWKNVFAFTFIQQIKAKSFIIGTAVIMLITALISALANIIPGLMLGDDSSGIFSDDGEAAALTVDKLYICDITGMGFSFEEAASALGLTLENVDKQTADSTIERLKTSDERGMVAIISLDAESGLAVDSRYSRESTGVRPEDGERINAVLASQIKAQYLMGSGLSADALPLAMSNVYTVSGVAGEGPRSLVKDMANTLVPMLSSIILFIFIFSYSQLVAQSVAIEKSSRIMEYLLTSVKPLAIIMGKVLAMCCVSLMQFLLIIAGGAIGFFATMPFGLFAHIGELDAGGALSGSGIQAQNIISDLQSVFSSVNAMSVIVMLLTFILGFLLFAILAGLAGASVSKMEDLASAMQPLSIIGVLGFYLAYFPQVTASDGENVMMVVARYLPISSPFILPSDYMLGRLDTAGVLIALVILAAVDVLLMMLVAKVYEHIVLHTGSKLSIKDMLKLANNK